MVGMLVTMTNGLLTLEQKHIYEVPEPLGLELINGGCAFQVGIL